MLRFRDAVWDNRRGKKGKLGELLIVAEVVGPAEREGEIKLLVRGSEVVADISGGRLVHPLKAGETIARNPEKILKWGKPERRAWTDESARDVVVGVSPEGRKLSCSFSTSRHANDRVVSVHKTEPEKDPALELDALIGLDGVKDEIRKKTSLVKLNQQRLRAGLPEYEGASRHMVFTGNPGTGKTIVSRIVGRIYKFHGVLRSGHVVEITKSDLGGSNAAAKMTAAAHRALDGVLFIDEAYFLVPKNTRGTPPAIQALITMMEDNRDRLVVIVAGYKDEMKDFLECNAGLRDRFKTVIDFRDYSSAELFDIFETMVFANRLKLSADASAKVGEALAAMARGKGFANGRAVRNFFQDCMERQALRLVGRECGQAEMALLESDDIPGRDD